MYSHSAMQYSALLEPHAPPAVEAAATAAAAATGATSAVGSYAPDSGAGGGGGGASSTLYNEAAPAVARRRAAAAPVARAFVAVLALALLPGAAAQNPDIPQGGGVCATAADCSLGGVCGTNSTCECDVWFTGADCALLNLAPAADDKLGLLSLIHI